MQIRATSKLLSPEVESNQALQKRLNLLSQRFDAVQSVFNPGLDSKANIVTELKKRGDEFEQCERELFASNCKIKDLERKQADQRAFFVQNELLRFKKRGYAHNPKVLANATAGLPDIGCRHSFRICSQTDPPAWPLYRFQVIEFIRRTWESRQSGSGQSPADLFIERIRQLPRTVKVAREIALRYKLKSKVEDNYLRRFLCENWRFLRMAINQVCIHKIHPKVVAYLITAKFYANLGKPRTAQDDVLIEMEMLSE